MEASLMSHPAHPHNRNIFAAARSFRARALNLARSLFPVPPNNAIAASVLAVAVVFLAGCITVDKSVHVFATIDASGMSRVEVHTTTENISDTKADGNSASAEADIKLPLLP
jgi:hypothetical protein